MPAPLYRAPMQLAIDGGGCVAITASERASRCDVAAQVFAFLALWSWVLLIIFRLLVFLYVRQFPHHGYHVAACVSSIVPRFAAVAIPQFRLFYQCELVRLAVAVESVARFN
ncbi:unnamed protein product [Heligmosomoides polygyrus]|uniref:G_PROTEIN_RECEP_F1_2 domain-containing protein n=1 Tax=Heligmosomoides polygyrus TaxID=6339 RepID=A0A183FDQ0_HELPZ|nr:unnamed protein product [Heligmosomoides polygyrus]